MKIEIKQKENEIINRGKPQLVLAYKGEVVITTGKHKDDTFEGFNFNQKCFSHFWTKSSFKKFNGEITLSNE